MAAGGDQIQVAADSLLGRMEKAEVVGPVDDPELFVAGRGIQDFLVHAGSTISVENRILA